MYPILVGEGVWALPSYFTLVMLGFFVCGILLRREFMRVGWDAVRAIDMVFALVVASLHDWRTSSLTAIYRTTSIFASIRANSPICSPTGKRARARTNALRLRTWAITSAVYVPMGIACRSAIVFDRSCFGRAV